MKIKTKILPLAASVMFLSACSLSFSGSDGGVFRSEDGGKSFSRKISIDQSRNISSTDVLSLSVNPQNGNEAYIGTASSGIFKTENAGDTWSPLKIAQTTAAKVYSIAINPQNPNVIYAVASIAKRGKIIKSENGGDSWRDVYTEPGEGTLVLSLAVNQSNPNKIFAGTEKGLVISSEDGGDTWRTLNSTSGSKAVYKIAIDSANPDVAYFVLFESGIIRTSDGGKSFQELQRNSSEKSSLSRNLRGVVTIAADPSRSGWLYISVPEGLLRSKNRGDDWEVVKTLNKPNDAKIRSIAINPVNSDEIICGAAQAFYKSNDGGVNWLPVQFSTKKTIEVLQYNKQNPSMIYLGVNKR